MIQIASNYADQLKQKFRDTQFDEKYMYYHNRIFYQDFEINDNTWDRHQFAILNDFEELIGYVGYAIDRQTHSARDMGIINFGGSFITFASDLMTIIRNIFMKYELNKLTFNVVVGNPIEKHFDRLVNRLGGRIVGVFHNDTRLINNHIHDVKWYEVLREDYLNYLEKK